MSNRNYSKEELDAALASMGLTDQTDVSRYGSGHINDTFKVETKRGVRFILQRINTDIFPPEPLKETILRVTRHLTAKGIPSLEVVGYENPWRLYKFLEGYTSRDVVEEPRQAYDVARAFAKFQNDCADMPAPRLADIIPKFHDTPDRMRQLDEAVKVNYRGRLANVGPEMAFVESWRTNTSKIVDLMAAGEIPERITHNDTKINNVLVAADGTAVVIDLDTTMPGSALYDFGDMVRTSSAAAAEDEKDLSKVYSKKEYFEQLVKGYLEGAKFLNDAEKAHLAFAGRLSTFEVGIRFLADYLKGDVYFHTAYEDHNLIRARTQFKMVQSMEEQAGEYEAIVRKYL
ncbi:MAG: phosphotransferase enzyme family protein [Kiritimatiellia bacterium]